MPRAVQAFPRNAVVDHNPMQRMLFDPTSIAKMGPEVMKIPDTMQTVEEAVAGVVNLIFEAPQLLEDVINAILDGIGSVTGVDLTGFTTLIDDILSWIENAGAAFSRDWLNFQQLVDNIANTIDGDVNDLITALSNTSTDAATALSNWTTVLADLGIDAPGFATMLADITVWINQAGAALTQYWLNFQQLINGITGEIDADVTDLVAALTAAGDAFTTLLESTWTAISGGGSYTTVMTALEAAWATYTTTVSGLEAGAFATLEQLIDALLGISPTELQALQTDFTELQSDVTASNAAFATLLTSTWTAVETYTSWSTFLTAIESAWNTYATAVSGLASDEIATVQQILDTLLGINPATGVTKVAETAGFASKAFTVDTVYPRLTGRGLLSATSKSTKAIISVALSGRGGVLPRPGSNDIQMWETFNSILGVITHIYPDVFNRGTLTATAANSKFTLSASVVGRGALTPVIQEWQTFQSIVGRIEAIYPALSGRGVLTATARSSKFTVPATMSSRGALQATVQDWQVIVAPIYGLNPPLSARGVLKATAASSKFTIPASLSGRGTPQAVVQDWQIVSGTAIYGLYPVLAGRGVLKATAPSDEFKFAATISGHGVLTPTIQDWQTFSSIIGRIEVVYPSLFGRGVLTATAASSKFNVTGMRTGRGVLQATVQDWQVLVAPIYGLTPILSARGVLKATAASSKFTIPAVVSGRGALTDIVQQWQIIPPGGAAIIYGLYPVCVGRGVLKATAQSDEFKFAIATSGRGVLLAAVQDWQTFQSIIGVINHIYLDLFGRGVLSASVTVKQFSLTGSPTGRGVLSAKVPDVTTSSFVTGTKAAIYGLQSGRGVLTISAPSKQFRISSGLSGRGVLSVTILANVPGGVVVGITAIEQSLINALWDALTGNLTGTISQLQAGFNDLMTLLGVPTGLGSGSPVASPVSSVPLLGSVLSVTDTNVVDDIFTSSTPWVTLLLNLFGGTLVQPVVQVPAIPTGIPPANISGILGPTDIGLAVQAVLDGLWQTIQGWLLGVNQSDTGNSIADLGNTFTNLLGVLTHTTSTAVSASTTLNQRAVAKPTYHAVDATADAVFPIAQISGSSPTYVSTTPNTSVIGYVATPDSGVKQTIIWLGNTTANITAMFLSIYSVAPTTIPATQYSQGYGVLKATARMSKITGPGASTGVGSLAGVVSQYGVPSTRTFTKTTYGTGVLKAVARAKQISVSLNGNGALTGKIKQYQLTFLPGGTLTKQFTSPNILSQVPNSLAWNYYAIPSANYITSSQGNWYAVEMTVQGSNSSYQIAGLPNHWLPANTSNTVLYPQSMGSSRAPMRTPVFSAVGVGNFTTGASPVTVNTTITAALGDAIFVFVGAFTNSLAGLVSCTVTYGGVSMTETNRQSPNNTLGDGSFLVFSLLGAGTGTAQTVSVTVAFPGVDTAFVTMNAVSYANVGAIFSGVNSGFGSNTLPQISGVDLLLAGTSGLTLVGFENVNIGGTVSLTAVTNQRSNQSAHGPSYPAVAISEMPSTQSLANCSGTNAPYSALAVVLSGAYLSPPATVLTSPYSNNIPWFALGGAAGMTEFTPVTAVFNIGGSQVYHIPTGMLPGDYLDIVLLGGGGGGGGGSGLNYGGGGSPGLWKTITLQYGVSFPSSTTTFTVNVGAGGSGTFLDGGGGTFSSVVITGYSPLLVSGGSGGPYAKGGVGGIVYFGGAAGDITYGPIGPTYNTIYYGGGTEGLSSDLGLSPGGGGSGGSFGAHGGDGASGAVWITAYRP